MKTNKELMNRFIEKDAESVFELFYNLMTRNVDLKSLDKDEKIIAECIKNQCTVQSGSCYELYLVLKKIKNTKIKNQIVEAYEKILKLMCREMFFNALR